MSRPAHIALMLLLLVGCERAEHDMYAQPKLKPQSPSPLFADGNSARTPPKGSVPVAAGAAAATSSGRLGHLISDGPLGIPETGGAAAIANDNPLPLSMGLLERGRQRFDIYCAPCHGRSGEGHGMVVQRGFPAPPSLHDEPLRNASDRQFYDVITGGYGVMYPYADRIAPPDRWAIVAYIRALQLSQNASRDVLEAQDLAKLPTTAAQAARTRQ